MRYLFCALLLLWVLPPPARATLDFTLSNPVVVDTSISVDASMSGTTSNYYLQGTLRSVGSSKYFGATGSSSGWVDYVSSPEKEFITSNFFQTNVQNASWSGQLKMRYFVDDDNYSGPGPYELKVRRFTGGSTSAAGESNTLIVNLTATLPSPSPSPSPSPTPTPTPISSPSTAPSVIPSPVGVGSTRPSPTPRPDLSPPPAGTVAGDSTEIDLSGFGIAPTPIEDPSLRGDSSQGPTLNQSRAKTVILIGSGLILLSIAGFFAYRRYLATRAPKGSDLEG